MADRGGGSAAEDGAVLVALAVTVAAVTVAGLAMRTVTVPGPGDGRVAATAAARVDALVTLLQHRVALGHGLPARIEDLVIEGHCRRPRVIDPASGGAGDAFGYRCDGGAFGRASLWSQARGVERSVDAGALARRSTRDALARARRAALAMLAAGRGSELAAALRASRGGCDPLAAALGVPVEQLRDGRGRPFAVVGDELRAAGADGTFASEDAVRW